MLRFHEAGMSNHSPDPVLPRAAAGHEAKLTFSEGVLIGRPILVRELDVADEAVAHAVLTDIMAEHVAGTITTPVRYKGKHPRRWFVQIFPDASKPRLLGFFFPDNRFLGWLSITTSPALPGMAVLGVVIRPPYRNLGLGTAAILHVEKHLGTITKDPAIDRFFFETEARNRHVIHIARKLRVGQTGTRVDVLKGGVTMLQFTTTTTR
jgi:RimJ/RimL family protein N-acetyltransferase